MNQAENQIESPSGFTDVKTWAINCADEIKTELKVRSQLRQDTRNLALIVFNKNGGGGGDTKSKNASAEDSKNSGGGTVSLNVDDNEVVQKRLQYWDYLRSGTQFISL